MDRDEHRLLEASIAACIAMRLEPSVRNVARMSVGIRASAGLPARPLWRETVRAYLAAQTDTLAIQTRYASDTPFVLKTAGKDTPTIRQRPPRTGARITKESLQPTNGKTSNTLLPTVGVAADAASLPEWAERIQRRVRANGSREVRTLGHDEMHDMASLHVIRFMSRKHRDEDAVRKAAVPLAGRIRNVTGKDDHPKLHTLTVREYFGYGREVWVAAGKQDWDYPWAVVTWAEAPEKAPS